MALERNWEMVSPQTFVANGTQYGLITLADTAGFKVKQSAYLTASTQPTLAVQIKRVISPTQLIVGRIDNKISNWIPLDISAYTVALGASIGAQEQPKNGITPEDITKALYESDPTVALRNVLVDKYGQFYDSNNPFPVDVEVVVGDVQVDLDGFDLLDPDSVQITGSEDGTKTGIKHGARVDSELDLRVGISDGANKAEVNVLGQLSVRDADVLAAVDAIVTQLQTGGIIVGTENGTLSGTQRVFVNNLRQQILASHDRDQSITYADFGTKDQRITRIDYVSPTFSGITARKNLVYSLVGTRYRRDQIVWSLV